MGKIQIDYTKVESYVLIQSTVKPVLKATSEQRPPYERQSLFWGPKGGCFTQAWLQIILLILIWINYLQNSILLYLTFKINLAYRLQ